LPSSSSGSSKASFFCSYSCVSGNAMQDFTLIKRTKRSTNTTVCLSLLHRIITQTAVHNIRKEKIRPPPKEKECAWCKENIALDAFRCKFCQSFVKDIPGIEDAGVGMFVTIKRPSTKHRPSMDPSFDQSQNGLDHNALAAGMAAGVIAASKERDNNNSNNNSNSRSGSNNNISSSSSRPHSQSHPTSNGNTGKQATTGQTSTSTSPAPPPHASRSGSTVGPSDGKKIAAGLAKVDGAQK